MFFVTKMEQVIKISDIYIISLSKSNYKLSSCDS